MPLPFFESRFRKAKKTLEFWTGSRSLHPLAHSSPSPARPVLQKVSLFQNRAFTRQDMLNEQSTCQHPFPLAAIYLLHRGLMQVREYSPLMDSIPNQMHRKPSPIQTPKARNRAGEEGTFTLWLLVSDVCSRSTSISTILRGQRMSGYVSSVNMRAFSACHQWP